MQPWNGLRAAARRERGRVLVPGSRGIPFRPSLSARGNLSAFRFCGHLPRSATMKRIVLALVLALGVFGVVGCGGGSSSGKTGTTPSGR